MLICSALMAFTGLTFTNETLVDQQANVYDLDAGDLVPPGTIGELTAAFDFQSDQWNGRQQQYTVGPMKAFWTLEDSQGTRFPATDDAGWNGAAYPTEAPTVTFFDPATGLGTALVRVPIGGGLESHQRHPAMPEEDATIRVAIGWAGSIGHDPATREPNGLLGIGTLTVPHAPQSVWVDLLNPETGPAGEVHFTLYSNDTANERTFVIQNNYSSVIALSDELQATGGSITFPAGGSGYSGTLKALDFGDYRLDVLDQGVLVAQSAIGSVVENYPVDEDIEDENGYPMYTATTWVPLPTGFAPGSTPAVSFPGATVRTQIFWDCKKAAFPAQGLNYRHCGTCSTDPQVSCPSFGTFFAPADCIMTLWTSGCIKKHGGSNFHLPVYVFDKGPNEVTNGCPKVGGGFFPFSSAEVQLSKMCCDYKLDTSSAPTPTNVQDCI
jgi:hypothetical protein